MSVTTSPRSSIPKRTHKRRQVELKQTDQQQAIRCPSTSREPDKIPPNSEVEPPSEQRDGPFDRNRRSNERDPRVYLGGPFSRFIQAPKTEELWLQLLNEWWGSGQEDED